MPLILQLLHYKYGQLPIIADEHACYAYGQCQV